MRFFQNQSVVSKAAPRLIEEGFSAVAWVRSDIHGNLPDTFDASKGHGFNWAIIKGRASVMPNGPSSASPLTSRIMRWVSLPMTKRRDGNRYRPLGASVASGKCATLCGPSNGIPGLLGEIRYLALVASPMNSDEHRSFYNSFSGELNLLGNNGPAAPMATPVLKFDPAQPERLAQ